MLGGAIMEIQTDFSNLMNRLKEKYPTTTEQDREEAITYAVTQYLKLTHEDTYDIQNLVFMDWIRRACFELLDRKYVLGVVGGVKQYSENGYQFTLDGTEISNALAFEIAKVGFPK